VKRTRPAPQRESDPQRMVAESRAGTGGREETSGTLRQPVDWPRNAPPDDGDDEGISNL